MILEPHVVVILNNVFLQLIVEMQILHDCFDNVNISFVPYAQSFIIRKSSTDHTQDITDKQFTNDHSYAGKEHFRWGFWCDISVSSSRDHSTSPVKTIEPRQTVCSGDSSRAIFRVS